VRRDRVWCYTSDKGALSQVGYFNRYIFYILHMKRNVNLRLPTLPPIASPEQLAAEAAAAVREILAEAASANTARSYASALRYCAAWYPGLGSNGTKNRDKADLSI